LYHKAAAGNGSIHNLDVPILFFGKFLCNAESESDTGCGISEEKKSHIFERFYRADDAHTDREHFGLGLCIAKELTEKQNPGEFLPAE